MRGVILAGGAARRFGGRPKGLERVAGVRLLDRVAEALTQALGTSPLLVANAPDAATWRPDLETVADVRPGTGALGGILTAIERGPAPVVVVAWDMPFVTPALVAALAHGLADGDACLPESDGPLGLEPLCAAWGPAAAPVIRTQLDAGLLAIHDVFPRLRLRRLDRAHVAACGDPAFLFSNVNTPADLAAADARLRPAS